MHFLGSLPSANLFSFERTKATNCIGQFFFEMPTITNNTKKLKLFWERVVLKYFEKYFEEADVT